MRRLLVVLALALVLVVGCESPSREVSAPDADQTADAAAFTTQWHGPDGSPAERGDGEGYSFEVHADDGPPHCEWDPAVFLSVGWPLGTSPRTASDMRQYLRDPEGAVRGAEKVLLGELDLDVRMPAGATDTGYRTEQAQLWFGPDGGDTYAYLKTTEGVERWPRAREAIACA